MQAAQREGEERSRAVTSHCSAHSGAVLLTDGLSGAEQASEASLLFSVLPESGSTPQRGSGGVCSVGLVRTGTLFHSAEARYCEEAAVGLGAEAGCVGSLTRWLWQRPDLSLCDSRRFSGSPLPPRNQVSMSHTDSRALLPWAASLSWHGLLDFFQNSRSVREPENQTLW